MSDMVQDEASAAGRPENAEEKQTSYQLLAIL